MSYYFSRQSDVRRADSDDFSEWSTYDIKDLDDFLTTSKSLFEKSYGKSRAPSKYNMEFFEIIRTIGVGSFSKIVLAKLKGGSTYHAIKISSKDQLVSMSAVRYSKQEKDILRSINFPFIIRLQSYFQDNSYIYLVLPFINGGDIFGYLKKKGSFSEKAATFYVAQVVLCLEFLVNVDYFFVSSLNNDSSVQFISGKQTFGWGAYIDWSHWFDFTFTDVISDFPAHIQKINKTYQHMALIRQQDDALMFHMSFFTPYNVSAVLSLD